MSNHRNSRTLSISGATYARLRAFCDANGFTAASIVERLLENLPNADGGLRGLEQFVVHGLSADSEDS